MGQDQLFFQKKFEQEIGKLNRGQRSAVETIEGPVLVLAGPGTGKTQILTARIGKILLETDTLPQQILCLTFTDNGRIEMRNRLFQIIGPVAYQVPIHTFHSFCNEVIRNHSSLFGKVSMEPLSPLEEIDLLRQLLDGLDPGNILKRFKGEVYYETRRLKDLFSRMKREVWTVEFMEEKIAGYLQDLPFREGFIYKRKYKEFHPGDPNPNKIQEEKEKLALLQAALKLYPVYLDLMSKAGRYTFDDMILWVLRAFQDHPNLLQDYQERFLYFLVDEFQDTSGAQNQILELLTGYWDAPNIFVVGDDDQSIFSFQDANVANIRHFVQRFRDPIFQVVLTENYRSTQAILDISKVLIEVNQERITRDDPSLNKNLVAAKESLKNSNVLPEIREFANPAQEIIGVAEQISSLVDSGIDPGEIAVIYRKHLQVEALAIWMEKRKIPVSMRRAMELQQVPLVKQILKILEYISLENELPYSGESLLFEILHFDFFDLPPLEIARISSAVFLKNSRDRKEKETRERYSIRREIAGSSLQKPPTLFETPSFLGFKSVSNILEGLIRKLNNGTLQELFESLLQETGILKKVIHSPEKPWLLQVLTSLFDFLKQETKRRPELSLGDWLRTLELMKDNHIDPVVQKILVTTKGVQLLTAHAAKGSEFTYVFLIGCQENIWDTSGSGGESYKFPDNLISSSNVSTDLEESRRLFYVAMTRAKTHLYISYALKDNLGKDLSRSTFVNEILSKTGLEPVTSHPDQAVMEQYLALQFTAGARPEIDLLEKEYISRLLRNYTLSVTHLNTFLHCPLQFYYQQLLKVPAAKSESMSFGSAVHFALQRLFEKMKDRHHIFPDKQEFLQDFSWFMHRNRESFTREQFARKMEYGQQILPAYYDAHIGRWTTSVSVEKTMSHIVVSGVPLNGKLDKLEYDGHTINVVDYKTGNYSNAQKKLTPPSPKEPLGGDYWRQGVFYKILLDHERPREFTVSSTEFDFIEPVKKEYKRVQLNISPQDIEKVLEQITDTWGKIQRQEFQTGCGKENCYWCNFIKENHFQVSLDRDLQEENAEPDDLILD
ncbi:MAG: ATP-dependent helicase [Chitinophagaceae bacterium]